MLAQALLIFAAALLYHASCTVSELYANTSTSDEGHGYYEWMEVYLICALAWLSGSICILLVGRKKAVKDGNSMIKLPVILPHLSPSTRLTQTLFKCPSFRPIAHRPSSLDKVALVKE